MTPEEFEKRFRAHFEENHPSELEISYDRLHDILPSCYELIARADFMLSQAEGVREKQVALGIATEVLIRFSEAISPTRDVSHAASLLYSSLICLVEQNFVPEVFTRLPNDSTSVDEGGEHGQAPYADFVRQGAIAATSHLILSGVKKTDAYKTVADIFNQQKDLFYSYKISSGTRGAAFTSKTIGEWYRYARLHADKDSLQRVMINYAEANIPPSLSTASDRGRKFVREMAAQLAADRSYARR